MKKILIQKLKKDEGFTGQDILIAIFITIAFLSLIVTMLINLSNTSYEINKHTNLGIVLSFLFDKIDKSLSVFFVNKELKIPRITIFSGILI